MGDTVPFPGTQPPTVRKLTSAKCAEAVALYRKTARQIRRWFAEGAPLDNPAEMPGWWAKGHKHLCPPEILAAAEAARPAPAPGDPLGQPQATSAESMVLDQFTLEEGEEVRQMKRLVAVSYSQLERAYAGQGGNIDLLQAKWAKACEALRKTQATERDSMKARGLLIERSKVTQDIATAAELLRQMRESMARVVLERCPSLNFEQREEVSAAILTIRESEDRVFRNIKSLKSPADVASGYPA